MTYNRELDPFSQNKFLAFSAYMLNSDMWACTQGHVDSNFFSVVII